MKTRAMSAAWWAATAAALLLAGCATPPAPPPPAAATPTPTTLLDACMKVEVPAALQRLGVDPKMPTREDAAAFAYLMCQHALRSCSEAPAGEACSVALARYGLRSGPTVASTGRRLFDAAHAGDTANVRQLLAQGAEVNWRNVGGWSPLMIAAAERHAETVAALLEGGADPNHRNHYGRTALMFAAGYGQTAIVERLLAGGADPNLVPTDSDGYTALAMAASRGHAAAVAALLKGGADAALRTRDGRTPADLARAGGHVEVLRLLDALRPARS